MSNISIVLPDELISYLDKKVEDCSALIESLLQQWRRAKQLAQQQDDADFALCL